MITIAAIDPGATSGLVIVRLPEAQRAGAESILTRQRAYALDHAQLVMAAVISTSGRAHGRSDSERRAPLFELTRRHLIEHRVDQVVIERPSDIILGGFKSAKRKKAGEGTGTAFGLGNHFGLVEAAALASCVQRIFCYKIRSTKGEIGWMQRRETKTPAREHTLTIMRGLMRDLAKRPANGIVQSTSPGSDLDDENVLMALGVLVFHFDRERGRV